MEGGTPIRAVIFDFDGTLVDFVNSDIACITDIYQDIKISAGLDDFIDRAVFHIMRFHELVDLGKVDPLYMDQYRLFHTFRDFGIAWKDSLVSIYKERLLQHTKPYPGIIPFLQKLYGHVKLGILTNAYDPVMQTRRIQSAGLSAFFNQVQIAGEEEYAKPDPKAFHKICTKLGCMPSECLFIGDSPEYDIAGAKSAGMKTILIQRGDINIKIKPDHTVRSPDQIETVLKGIDCMAML